MSKTPEDIKKEIEAESIAAVENAFAKGKFTYPESYCDLYEQGAYFALTLSLERIGELEKEVERVKKVAANAFHEFRMRGFPHNEPTWEQFKTANNL